LIHHPIFESSRHIACYYAHGSEFDTQPIMNAIWQAEKICYLPVMTDAKALRFSQYNQGDELQSNQHMILEPVSKQHMIRPEKLDLVLVPLLAFDFSGGRVGTGGGYYDRTFAFLFTRPDKAPTMLGVGYAMQVCDEIQAEPWDVKLNGVLTEQELIVF
jgi:5-formyltetrahydrofolate cyclo-ligase